MSSHLEALPALELHGARTGNCLRAAIGLHEAGLSYRLRHVDLRHGEQQSESHLAFNPRGKVPVLVVRETETTPLRVITQSNAILFYAAECSPGRLLPEVGSQSRVKALDAFFHFITDIIALSGVAFTMRLQGDVDASTALTHRYMASIQASEFFLSEAGYMGGDDFSIADIAAFTIIQSVEKHLPWARLPRLQAWCDQIAARPAVRNGMQTFDKNDGDKQ